MVRWVSRHEYRAYTRKCRRHGSLLPFSADRAPAGQNTRTLTLLSPRVYFRGTSMSSSRPTGTGGDWPGM
jgi:hypothetical protein